MRHSPIADVVKILLYVACTLLLGAAMAPWVYNAGMGIAETTEHKDTNGAIEWIAAAAERADFPRYFDRALMISSILLLLPLFSSLKKDTSGMEARAVHSGQILKKASKSWSHLLIGFGITVVLIVLSIKLLLALGWLEQKHGTLPWLMETKRVTLSIVVMSVWEEWLFRGLMLGIFLRAMSPGYAIVLISLLSAFTHFMSPPNGFKVPDPEALNAGFVLLRQLLLKWLNPGEMIRCFTVFLAGGWILSLARYRTASLWLPIGLSIGWALGFQIFNSLVHLGKMSTGSHWLLGNNLKEGLIPLALVLISGWIALKTLPLESHEAE